MSIFDLFTKIFTQPKKEEDIRIDDCLQRVNEAYGNNYFIIADDKEKWKQYNLTYGELTNDGVKKIVKYLKRHNFPLNCFIDLGCGNGKTLVYSIINGFQKAQGIEIVDKRYHFGVNAINKLDQPIKENINMVHGDIFTLENNFFPNEPVVIFISNLLFSQDLNNKMIRLIDKKASPESIIILSRLPKNLLRYKVIKTLIIPMSWDQNSTVYILSKK